jgi:hypothetical protein
MTRMIRDCRHDADVETGELGQWSFIEVVAGIPLFEFVAHEPVKVVAVRRAVRSGADQLVLLEDHRFHFCPSGTADVLVHKVVTYAIG